MTVPGRVEVVPLTGLPEISAGAALAETILEGLARLGLTLADGDVLVVSSKVVSKAAGLRAPLHRREAVVAAQTRRVVAERRTGERRTGERRTGERRTGERRTRVVQSVAGPVMAAAGVDSSNTGPQADLLLLPADPDAAAAALLADLRRLASLPQECLLGVVLSDTAGRPWRAGQVDFALGAAGLRVLDDLRGGQDGDGRPLAVTERAVADELAAAADLVKGKSDGVPVALVRQPGAPWLRAPGPGGAAGLVRTGAQDWFSHGTSEAVRAALGVEPGSGDAERIGLPETGPEPAADRLRRAVAVALHAVPDGAVAVQVRDATPTDPELGQLRVSGLDPYAVGLATGRLQAALWGEGLTAQLPTRPQSCPHQGAAGSDRARGQAPAEVVLTVVQRRL